MRQDNVIRVMTCLVTHHWDMSKFKWAIGATRLTSRTIMKAYEERTAPFIDLDFAFKRLFDAFEIMYPFFYVSAAHHHLSLFREGHWGTTDNFATSFLHFPPFSTALWDLANSRPFHSLMLSSHLFLCLLLPFTVPCKMVLARPDERET